MTSVDNESNLIHQIACVVQKYAWGKTGRQGSLVYALHEQEGKETAIDEPHAELWMGTHVNGPSRVMTSQVDASDGPLLSHFLAERQGDDGWLAGANGQLPFLLKVLSVGTALSIQCHPDKQRAEIMHAENPQNYKDSNHKPELCVALTDFEALCGFRPWQEIAGHMRRVTPLKKLLDLTLKKSGNEQSVDDVLQKSSQGHSSSSCIRTLFSALMQSDCDDVRAHLREIISQYKESEDATEKLVFRLNEQYPDDVGCLAAYFLNKVHLKAGEGLFMGPNEPHAYLNGDLVECMACSDNVVRAGLTPKFRDVQALCEMLTYRDDSLQCADGMHLGRGTQVADHVSLYQPPAEFPEFQVYRVVGNATVNVKTVSIAIVISGSGRFSAQSPKDGDRSTVINVSSGNVFVIKGACDLSVQFTEESDVDPVVFIASARE